MNPLLRLAIFVARILPQPIKLMLYKIKPLANWLRSRLNKAAPLGLTEIQVAAGELSGIKLLLDLQTKKDYWLGTYEPELQNAARKFVKPGMVIFDVGANIGYISLLMARLCGENGRVFSFEALPNNVLRLQKNIALNHMQSIIKVIPKAVVDASHPVSFLTHTSDAMGKALGSVGRDEHYEQEIKVAGITLDDFVFLEGNPAPDLIKMDIEGGEVLAVKGMQRLLKEKHPVMFIELHGEEAAKAMWLALPNAGYEILRMGQGYPRIRSQDELGWKAYIIARQSIY
jgi:FkbM family methyltransferase